VTLGVGVLLAFVPVAGAQTTPEAVSGVALPVEALVARAFDRAPSLAARRARVEAAEAAVHAAGALPDPMIEIEYQDFNFPEWTVGSDPNSMIGGSYRQPLSSRGRRRAQRAVAEAEVGQRLAVQVAAATDLASQVRLLYARLFVLDRERETLLAAEELTRLLEVTATARYAAGQGDQASVLRIQLERTRLGERQLDLDTERIATQAALNRLTDDPPDTPVGRVAELPVGTTPSSTTPVGDVAVERAVDVAVRRSEVDLASRQVEASREELKPSWTVEGGYYWQGGTDRMVNFLVGVELPVWKKRKVEPLIAAAESGRRAAQLELAGAVAEVRAEAWRLLVESETATRQITRYREAILPQSSAALDATRSSYLGGRGEFASVLDEFRRWIEVRVQLARRESDRYSALVRLEAVLSPGHDADPATTPSRAAAARPAVAGPHE
jgi:outer membrane protein TolC